MKLALLGLVSLAFSAGVAMAAIDVRSEQKVEGETTARATLDAPANPELSMDINGRLVEFSAVYPSSEDDAPWTVRAWSKEMTITRKSGAFKIREIKGFPGIKGTLNTTLEDGGVEMVRKDGAWQLRARISLTLSATTEFEADLEAVYPGQGMGKVHVSTKPVVVHHDDFVAIPDSITRQFIWNKTPYERIGHFFGGEIDQAADRKMRFNQLLKDQDGRLLLANITSNRFTDRPCPILQGRKVISQQLYGGTSYQALPEYLRNLLEKGGWTQPDEGSEKVLGCRFIQDDPELPDQLTLFIVELHRVDSLVTKVVCERFPFPVGEDFRQLLKSAEKPK